MTKEFTISSSIPPDIAEELRKVMPDSKLPEGVSLVTPHEILDPVKYIAEGKYPKPFVVIGFGVSHPQAKELVDRGAENIVQIEKGNLDADLLRKLDTVPEWVKRLKR